MAQPQDRLDAVNRVRAHQRAWIEETRASVEAGGPFAICNGDEAEEIFLALGIPVLAINYWNFLKCMGRVMLPKIHALLTKIELHTLFASETKTR